MAYLYQKLKALGINLATIIDSEHIGSFDVILVGDINVKNDFLSKKIIRSKIKKILF